MVASVASVCLAVSCADRSGARIRIPATMPAWRAAIVAAAREPSGSRPPSAAIVSTGRASARPMPIRSWGCRVSAHDAPGRTPSAARPPAIAIPPASAAEAGGPARSGDPAGRDRRHRDRRDRGGCRDRREAPALGEQDHEQEESSGEAGGEQAETDLGPEVERAAGAGLGWSRADHRRDRDQQQQRHLEEEDRLPVEELRSAGRRRPGPRRGRSSRPRPRSARRARWLPRSGAPAARWRRRRRGLRRRPGRRGQRSAQPPIRRRRRRARRRRREPGPPTSRRGDAAGDPHRGQDQQGEDDVEGGQDPGDAEDGRVVLAEDARGARG